jgi:hypothetical protein
MFKFVDEIQVFGNESKSELRYTISANKWLDFSASYAFTDTFGSEVGRVVRKGWASLWKARYEIYDNATRQDFLIQEENGWIKVADAVLGETPVLGLLTGYLFNPSYRVIRPDGTLVARMTKEASLLGRQFKVEKLGEFNTNEEQRLILGLMMMIILERRRG